MIAADDRERFLLRCRMTCIGGSEVGSCACSDPTECRMLRHPLYESYRSDAVTRLFAAARAERVTDKKGN